MLTTVVSSVVPDSIGLLPEAPFPLDDAAELLALRDAFLRAGYRSVHLDRLLYGEGSPAGTVLELPVSRRRVRGTGPLPTLARLFRLRAEVDPEAARAAFAPVPLERLVALGLLTLTDDGVRSPFDAREYDGLMLLGDRARTERDDLAANYVTSVNATSMALAAITIRRPIVNALDVGSGNGIQALLAARHARRVVAVDVNPRALNITAFNARLNGLDNVEVRRGSFFEPVAGECFDLIVANPPFVISPESRYLFRDAGLVGDALSRQIARQVAEHLSEGGLGHVLCNWVYDPDGDWAAPLQNWLHDAGCDVTALLYHTEDPVTYAAKWLKAQCVAHPEEYEASIDRWLTYYDEIGLRGIASGGLIIRRRSHGTNWFQGYAVPRQGHAPCGAQLERLIDIHDYLQGLPDEALLDRSLRVVAEHHLEQNLQFGADGYMLKDCRLCLDQPLSFEGRIDYASMKVLSRCDGSKRFRDLLLDCAREEELNPEEVFRSSVAMARQLMLMGFLVPGDWKV